MADEVLTQVTIEDHPIYTEPFDIEVPDRFDKDQVRSYVDTLDLDLALGVPKDGGVDTTDLTFITAHENAASAGLRDGRWYKFNNAAGNNEVNIGAGSVKLTADELASGTISIGGKEVDFTGGITSEQSDALAKERITSAESIALASLVKVGMNLDKDKVTALTSLIYSVGSGAWAESRAKKFLEAGNMEDFMHEAFSEESGWVHIAGKKSKGLIRRRAAEAERFGHTQVAEGDTQGAFAFLLDKLNPISTAQASPPSFNKPLVSPSHIVESGDTLTSIAKANNTTVNELAQLNPQIKDINKIYIGDKINLTTSPQPQDESILSALNPVSTAQAAPPSPPRRIVNATATEVEPSTPLLNRFETPPRKPDLLKPKEVPSTDDIISQALEPEARYSSELNAKFRREWIVKLAKSYLGTHERVNIDAVHKFFDNALGHGIKLPIKEKAPGGQNLRIKWGPEFKKDTLKSDNEMRVQQNAWCAAFAYTILTSAGVGRSKIQTQLDAKSSYAFTRANSWIKIGDPVWKTGEDPKKAVTDVKPGDIVIKYKKGLGHIGIVTGIDENTIKMIAGNHGDAVREGEFMYRPESHSIAIAKNKIEVRRPTGISLDSIPKEVIDDVLIEDKWGPIIGPIIKLFNFSRAEGAEGQDNLQGGAGEDTLDTVAEVANTVGEFIGPGADIRNTVDASAKVAEAFKEGNFVGMAVGTLEMLAGLAGAAIPGSQKIKAGGKVLGKEIDDLINRVGNSDMVKEFRKKAEYRTDHGPNGDWLASKVRQAEEDIAEFKGGHSVGKGLNGSPTATVTVDMPTHILKKIPGAADEARIPGDFQFDSLLKKVEAEGFKPKFPIQVRVNHKGEAFIYEGNTRVSIANRKGIPSVPTEVWWMNGADLVDGPLSPKVVAETQSSMVDFFTKTGKFGVAIPGSQKIKTGGKAIGKSIDDLITTKTPAAAKVTKGITFKKNPKFPGVYIGGGMSIQKVNFGGADEWSLYDKPADEIVNFFGLGAGDHWIETYPTLKAAKAAAKRILDASN